MGTNFPCIVFFAMVSKTAVVWSLLALVGMLGFIALVSPSLFASLSRRSGQWVDTNKLAQVLDRRVDIDHYVLPFSRLLGAAVLASVAVLAYIVAHYE
ncbi:MAG TPA: hypothetical protein VGJ15_10855 [Pirellulales bacterium]|jgi:hypothetical protein